MQMVITKSGSAHCVYDEAINLASLGQVTITRGSHVEPDAAGNWQADLSPVAGPVLGPFTRRSEALAAERQWLEQHWLGRCSSRRRQRPSSGLAAANAPGCALTRFLASWASRST